MKKIIALSLVAGSLLMGQKVTSIKFDGLVHLSPEVAKGVADIHSCRRSIGSSTCQ